MYSLLMVMEFYNQENVVGFLCRYYDGQTNNRRVAKNRLCRSILENNYKKYNKTILGCRLKNNRKDIYINVGHKISLETSIDIVKQLIKKSHFIPEPLRIADINSKIQ